MFTVRSLVKFKRVQLPDIGFPLRQQANKKVTIKPLITYFDSIYKQEAQPEKALSSCPFHSLSTLNDIGRDYLTSEEA